MTDKRRKSTRKAGCPDCGANCGSHHKTVCPWAYVPEPNSKAMKQVALKDKLKAILTIIKL